MGGNLKTRMRELLNEIDYDFTDFTIEGFARWLEARRGRKIVFLPWTMPSPGFTTNYRTYHHHPA